MFNSGNNFCISPNFSDLIVTCLSYILPLADVVFYLTSHPFLFWKQSMRLNSLNLMPTQLTKYFIISYLWVIVLDLDNTVVDIFKVAAFWIEEFLLPHLSSPSHSFPGNGMTGIRIFEWARFNWKTPYPVSYPSWMDK